MALNIFTGTQNRREDKENKMPKHTQTAYTPFVDAEQDPRSRILVISGLPGSGKTALASMVANTLSAVHFNADQVRTTVTKHLGFDKLSRLAQADALGNMARWVADSGNIAVVDFVCPIFDTRESFLNATGQHRLNITWVEVTRPSIVSRYEDTRTIYEPMYDSPFMDYLKVKFLHVINDDSMLTHKASSIVSFFKD